MSVPLPYDLRLPEDGTPFSEKAQSNDEANAVAIPSPGTLLQLAVQANRKIAFGAGTFVFTAANTSAVVTIAHGLGATPSVVYVSMQNLGFPTTCHSGAPGAVNVAYIAYTAGGGAITVNAAFSWMAIA